TDEQGIGREAVSFVHPVFGRPVWHLAALVSKELFSLALATFAHTVGARPTKQIRSCWTAPARAGTTVPGRGCPRRSPACSPALPAAPLPWAAKLQPVEHLWPLANTVLVNWRFARLVELGELKDAQAERCIARQACPDLVCSTTRCSWWPLRHLWGRDERPEAV